MKISMPRGTQDILPPEVAKVQFLEQEARELARLYNFQEIRTPIFEHTELFYHGVGEDTDIVEKEMYTFTDRKGRQLTLRPEGTAPVVRSFVEHKVYAQPQPTKWYYIGPMFRYERPQSGRSRQFVQFGVEVFGSDDPKIDAEVIAFVRHYLQQVGITRYDLHLNSIGCPDCRPRHREALYQFLQGVQSQLCSDCQKRMERNPLRVLDCKNQGCRQAVEEAPSILEYLCDACAPHFEQVRRHLDRLEIPYVVNPRLVRGLDYYRRTAFEFVSSAEKAMGTLAGGGRYNGLVAKLGGEDVPGVGFATSWERLLVAMQKEGVEPVQEAGLDAYLIALDEASREEAFRLMMEWRRRQLRLDMDFLDRKMKAQLRAADRAGARYALILGEDELSRRVVGLRDMRTAEQREVRWDEVPEILTQTREDDKLKERDR